MARKQSHKNLIRVFFFTSSLSCFETKNACVVFARYSFCNFACVLVAKNVIFWDIWDILLSMKQPRAFLIIIGFLLVWNGSALAQKSIRCNYDDLLETGLGYYREGKFTESIDFFSQAINCYPRIAYFPYFMRAQAKDSLKDYRGAMHDFGFAIFLNPRYAESYHKRGRIRAYIHDQRGAIRDFTRAIEINPKDSLSYFHRGISHWVLSEFDASIKDCSKAISLKKDEAKYYYWRAKAWDGKEKFKKALKDLDKAVELQPEFADAYYMRGKILVERLNLTEAGCEDLRQAQSLGKTKIDAYVQAVCGGGAPPPAPPPTPPPTGGGGN